MSTLTADPSFARGQTLGITSTNVYDASVGDGAHLLGVRKTFRDENPQTGALLSNHTVDCICVKNTSGGAILPGTLVKFKGAAILSEVDGGAVDGRRGRVPPGSRCSKQRGLLGCGEWPDDRDEDRNQCLRWGGLRSVRYCGVCRRSGRQRAAGLRDRHQRHHLRPSAGEDQRWGLRENMAQAPGVA